MSTRSRRFSSISLALVGLYIGVYLVLSLQGRYEPMEWGLKGPKSYQWAPRGFVREMRWKTAMIGTFLPCWELDRFFWHWEDRMFSGRLPIDKIAEPDAAGNSRPGVH